MYDPVRVCPDVRGASGLVVLFLVMAGLWSFAVGPAAADTTVTVQSTRDEATAADGCSLREALVYASGSSAPDCATGSASGTTTVMLPAGCYRLTLGQLAVTPPAFAPAVVVRGPGAGAVPCTGSGAVIDAQQRSGALLVNPGGAVSVSGVTLTGGLTVFGGGVRSGGNLTLTDVIVTANTTFPGTNGTAGGSGTAGGRGDAAGGIYNTGTLNVVNSTVSGNVAGAGGTGGDSTGIGSTGGAGGDGGSGGGIFNTGTLNIVGSTISGNSGGAGGTGGGGGVIGPGGNGGAGGAGGAGGEGGGIYNASGGTLTISNSTIAGNAGGVGGQGGQGTPQGHGGTGGAGGGLRDLAGASLSFVTVSANSASGNGDGVDEAGSAQSAVESNSVIAGNGTQNCVGPFTDRTFNLTFPSQASSNCPGVVGDPMLGPLRFNGGPTMTMALMTGSRAIDLGLAAGLVCPPSDQRGVSRPQGPQCDAGAYERAPPVIANVGSRATGVTTGSIGASVDPNLQDTTVAVRYGRTSAYGTNTPSQDIGAGGSPKAVIAPMNRLAPNTTYHAQLVATNADGTSRSPDMTFTTASVGSGGRGAIPRLAHLRQSARAWVEGNALARISRKHRPPVGTTFSFVLSEQATMRFAFNQRAAGRKLGNRCLPLTPSNRRKPSCRRTRTAGVLRFHGHPGLNSMRFQGRLSSSSKLRPGRYTLIATADRGSGARSAPASLSFIILRH